MPRQFPTLFGRASGLGGQVVAQRLQVEQEVLHDLIALLASLANGFADDALKLVRDVRLEACERCGLPV
jgi:hypothetical protein